MPPNPKHIIDDLEDFHKGVTDTLGTVLTGIVAPEDVVLAFKDPRGLGGPDQPPLTYPRVTVYIYDYRPDGRRRHGGGERSHVPTGVGAATTVTPKPVPVNVDMQVDTYSLTPEHNWAMQLALSSVMDVQQQLKVITAADRHFYLSYLSSQQLDEIDPFNWYRTAWRVRAEVWFASPTLPSESHIVQELHLTINDKLHVLDT